MLLKDLRDTLQNLKNIKITNEEIANIISTSSQNISKRIKNKSEVTVSELEKIQDYFGVKLYIKADDAELIPTRNTLERQHDISIEAKFTEFGTRLTDLQDKNNLLDKEMANLMGIDEKRYMTIKLGNDFPTVEELNKIKENFIVSIDYLLYGNETQQVSHNDIIKNLSPEKLAKLNKLLENL